MKKLFKVALFFTALNLQFTFIENLSAQCLPMLKIDGNSIVADENHVAGLKLPSWLKAGQTLEKAQYVFSISVIEFTINGTTLDYSQNLSITTPAATVPAGKVWKIESIHKDAALAVSSTTTFTSSGTFTPTCSGTYNVKVWGGGGGGGCDDAWCCGGCGYGGAGGGGGGYSEGNFYLTGGTGYAVTVGAGGTANAGSSGGAGGTSSVGTIGISATGGGGGAQGQGWCGGSAGAGGTGAGGQIMAAGAAGSNASVGTAGAGGKGGGSSGGVGGNPSAGVGTAPGGGGAGRSYVGGAAGGVGAEGKVEFSMSGTTSSRVPCVVLYQYGATNCSSVAVCPSGWTDGGCGATGTTYCRTCYKCD